MSANDNIVAVALSEIHTGGHKNPHSSIKLIKDYGVREDCHAGEKPLRQVSLLQSESLTALNNMNNGNDPLKPSELGENITTKGLNFNNFKQGTKLYFFDAKGNTTDTVVSITGMRRAGE